jgi:hypothetical protein
MTERIAVINTDSMIVKNIIMADLSSYKSTDMLVPSATANIGDSYNKDSNSFTSQVNRVTSKAALSGYASSVLQKRQNSGITVNVSTTSLPYILQVDTDPTGVNAILMLLRKLDDGSDTVNWIQSGGTIALTSNQLRKVYGSLEDYITSVVSTWQSIATCIEAGTITTKSQIDNPIPPITWPSTTF